MGNATGKEGDENNQTVVTSPSKGAKTEAANVVAEKNLRKFEPLRKRLSSGNIIDATALKLHEHDVLKCYEICQADIKSKVKQVYKNNDEILAQMGKSKKKCVDLLSVMEKKALSNAGKGQGQIHELVALEDIVKKVSTDLTSVFRQAESLDEQLNALVYADTRDFVAHPSRNSV